ncbi:MAG: metal-dependent hydrolase [Candidatus Nanoarchaeia archaeon]|nr:metal-dependent hydrolase [Candidatus Nanoarchaeia archaeon]
MLLKTHLMFAVLLIIIMLPYANNKIVFLGLVLIGTIIPDLDSSCSKFGKRLIFRPFQFFVKHRGIMHTFTFVLILFFILNRYYSFIAFPLLLGYSLHLITDSFTKQGIIVLWPLKFRIRGLLTTGGAFENLLFNLLVFLNIFLFLVWFVI